MLRVRVGLRHFYRYLTAKWAYLPLSGVGAASAGGRFNRPGVEALYLSAEPETALAEYKQGSSLPRPATLAAYELDLTHVLDLSAGYDPDHWAQLRAEQEIERAEQATKSKVAAVHRALAGLYRDRLVERGARARVANADDASGGESGPKVEDGGVVS